VVGKGLSKVNDPTLRGVPGRTDMPDMPCGVERRVDLDLDPDVLGSCGSSRCRQQRLRAHASTKAFEGGDKRRR
jgi:hypothetical protein